MHYGVDGTFPDRHADLVLFVLIEAHFASFLNYEFLRLVDALSTESSVVCNFSILPFSGCAIGIGVYRL